MLVGTFRMLFLAAVVVDAVVVVVVTIGGEVLVGAEFPVGAGAGDGGTNKYGAQVNVG